MFENLLGQPAVKGHLIHDISRGSLPASVLYHGPAYSGKSTAALEVARVLGCRRDGRWGCDCPSCRQNRSLSNPYLLMLGGRYFMQEIHACLEAFQAAPREASAYLLIRAVRKLTRRFDPVLWQGEEQKAQKAQAPLTRIDDFLEELLPLDKLTDKQRERGIKALIKDCKALVGVFSASAVPIFQVRNINSWARLSSGDTPKIVLIEDAEKMQESARNALLKILEEPPSGMHFILTTTRRGAIIPTILSRLRSYSFAPRGEEVSREILRRIFRDETGEYRQLRDFFLAWEEDADCKLRSSVHRFLSEALESDAPFLPDQYTVKDKKAFLSVLEEMLQVLQRINRDPEGVPQLSGLDLIRQEKILRIIRSARMRFEELNLGIPLILESMYYEMRKIGCENS